VSRGVKVKKEGGSGTPRLTVEIGYGVMVEEEKKPQEKTGKGPIVPPRTKSTATKK